MRKPRLRTADKVVIRDMYGHPHTIERKERKESTLFWCVMLVVVPAVIGALLAMANMFETSGGWR